MQANRKVLLAFSGGIDSTHCAKLLKEQGLEVTALTLDMTGDEALMAKAEAKASLLEIPFMAIDCKKRFQELVIDYFIGEYSVGRTPAPCTVCNPMIKWHLLYQTARELGFDHIATGHYFRIAEIEGKYYVRKASDPVKDQSYYLWMLPQHILAMALTPMGEIIKKEIVGALPQQDRRESMGICFLQGSSCSAFLTNRMPRRAITPGPVTDTLGMLIGRHAGIGLYTVGQKKGLQEILNEKIATGAEKQTSPVKVQSHGNHPAFYVKSIDPRTDKIVVAPKAELNSYKLHLSNWHFVDEDQAMRSGRLSVKIRGLGLNPEGYCRLSVNDGVLTANLDSPAWAPAPGQPAVFYEDDLVVGGGFLEPCL